MNRKIHKIIIIAISLLIIIIGINLFKKDIWDKNANLLKEKVLAIEETNKTVNLSDITPFEWDTAYSFSPYTPKELIYDTVGYKWDNIHVTVDESMNQIVFLKDKKVVCYIYGYPSNIGYGLSFDVSEYKNGVRVLKIEDNLNFQLTKNNGVVSLKQMKQ